MKQTDARITELLARLTALERERADVVAEINTLRSMQSEETEPIKVVPSGNAGDPTDRNSPIEKKLALFRGLFRGRSDVFPIRWENRTTGRSGYAPACANEWQRGICEKPKVKCSACPNQAFLAVDDVPIERHLRGTDANGAPFVMGVYPMLADNTCSFLAADFDEGEWRRDAFAFRDSCERHGIPVAIERSRSGNGAHAWIFFNEPIPAVLARRLGAFVITDTMERVPDIGFGSYDRFFPSQDSMPAGGFGNLIALPLQGLARSSGNSEFIDESCSPYPDQWAFLSAIEPMPRAKVEHLVEEASASGKILGVRIPLVDEDEEPWLARPSRRQTPPEIREPLPGAITLVQWRLTFDGESVSLHPSIGSWNLPCRSHYIISSGDVIEAPSWSDEEVAYGQVRDKRARTAHHVAKANAQLVTEPVKTSIPIERRNWLTSIRYFFTGRR